MDEQSEEIVPSEKKTRRKRGTRASAFLGPRRKRHRVAERSMSASDASPTLDSELLHDSENDTDEEIEPGCQQSLCEPHVCEISDAFSETATEFYSDAEDTDKNQSAQSKKAGRRKKRKSDLAYRRKVGKKAFNVDDSGSHSSGSDNNESNEVDIEGSDISLSDLSYLDIDLSDGDKNSVTAAAKMSTDPENNSSVQLHADTASTANEDFLKVLEEKIILLLPMCWLIDLHNQLLRFYKLNADTNTSVLKSVSFDRNSNSIHIFIHGKPVPKSNKIFKQDLTVDTSNIGSLADYLCLLISRVEVAKVCPGISNYKDQWEFVHGWIDPFVESDCLRSKDCLILVNGKQTICLSCRTLDNKFERERKRRERNPSSCPDKNLPREILKKKKDQYRKLYKGTKQRADRLQRRVDSLRIKLDAVLKDELSALLKANEPRMTEVQKLFWESQARALAVDDKRGLRWHPMLVRLALHLHSLSDGAYKFLRDSKILTLPSKRRLYDYAHFIDGKEGCQQELTQHIREKIEKCGSEDHFSYVNLMFDEMSIRAGLVINRSTGDLVGYTKLDGIEEELKQMQCQIESRTYKPMLAKKVLVYLAQGITSDVKDVVAVYSSDDLSAGRLYKKTWEVLYHLEDAGVKVLTVTCDGASVNRKFIFMHESLDKSCSYLYCTKNLVSGTGRQLFFIIDPPHLLKTIRNALANSFAHKKTRKLWKNGEELSWKVIELVYELTKHQKFIDHKLTKAHVKLSSFSCMTVVFATQVFSNSVARAIESLSNHKTMEIYHTRELVIFINLMNNFFDCVNGKEKKEGEKEETNPNKASFTNSSDSRFDFLQKDFLGYFEDWKEDVIQRPGTFSETQRNKMIISHQALGALQITVNSIVGAIKYMLNVAKAPAVSARVFNQDSLEQYFGKVRRMQGDNRNPFLKEVIDCRLNLHAQGLVSLSVQKGNTEGEEQKGLSVDSTPLQSRKISRQAKK